MSGPFYKTGDLLYSQEVLYFWYGVPPAVKDKMIEIYKLDSCTPDYQRFIKAFIYLLYVLREMGVELRFKDGAV